MSDRKVTIIVAIIGLAGTIAAAIIGAVWGKSNVTVVAPVGGKSIVLNDEDIKNMANENEKLSNEISEYKDEIENLKDQNEELVNKLGVANGELSDVPAIEFKNCGLSINGDEKEINKERSCVSINNRQYYSKDFIENLISDNQELSMKGDMLYIGKIIKEKANLLNMPVIKGFGGEIKGGITDSYGNTYADVLYLWGNGIGTVFNVGREYSNFKCTVAIAKDSSEGGSLKISTDEETVYTSEKITSLTESFEVDIPINKTSKLTIESVGDSYSSHIFIANATLYNQE